MIQVVTNVLLIAFAVTSVIAAALIIGPSVFAWLRGVSARRKLSNEINARRKQLKQLRGLADKGFVKFQ